jgi:hypothetical protein
MGFWEVPDANWRLRIEFDRWFKLKEMKRLADKVDERNPSGIGAESGLRGRMGFWEVLDGIGRCELNLIAGCGAKGDEEIGR